MLKTKRVYEPYSKDDGIRILVDRLWPRGLSKDKAKVDLWLRDIAPSTKLRKWFSHDPEKWNDFKKLYFQELRKKRALIKIIRDYLKKGVVTLVYGAKDEKHNNAVALKEYLEKEK